MLKPFNWLDDFLLTKVFTPVAHKWEYLTGQTNFRLAWYSYSAAGVAYVAEILFDVLFHQPWLNDLLIGLMMLAIMAIFTDRAEKADRASRNNFGSAMSKEAQWFVSTGSFYRIVWTIIVVWDSFLIVFPDWLPAAFPLKHTCWFLQSLFQFLGAYFGAVMRPPPKPQKQETGDLAWSKT